MDAIHHSEKRLFSTGSEGSDESNSHRKEVHSGRDAKVGYSHLNMADKKRIDALGSR